MSVYILHFSTPLKHARHYVGFTKQDVEARLQEHLNSTGARITQVCNEQGISYEVARVFKGEKYNRKFERKLKNTHSTKDYCPICMGDKCRNYLPKKNQ
jgi:predicted GIY-YIG superfamily endonuclease